MLEAISAGVPITAACQHAGISTSAHFRAMEQGQAADEAHERGEQLDARQHAYREYRDRVIRARAAVAVVNVALVAKAARGGQLVEETTRRYRDPETGEIVTETDRKFSPAQWKAAQFLLQTSFRDDFAVSSRQTVEHSGPGGAPIETHSPADDALVTIAARMRAVADLQAGQAPGGWDRPAPLEIGAAERAGELDAEIVADDLDDAR